MKQKTFQRFAITQLQVATHYAFGGDRGGGGLAQWRGVETPSGHCNQGKTWTRKEKSLPVIRPLQAAETPLLRDFLYEAIYVPEGVEPPPRSVVDLPELQVYIQDFGSRPGDNALVAESRGRVVGAVWARLMNDYGHVDDQTPSLAISLYPKYRGKGIGTQLMRAMLDRLHREGYAQVSLSVQKTNPAVRLYERLGFKTVRETDEEYVMVCLTFPP